MRCAWRGGTATRLAAVSFRVRDGVDPSAVVLASRAPGEAWMCFEQPERERSAVAALGAAVTLEDSGHQRFERSAARWRDLIARACVDPAGLARRRPARLRRLRLRARRRQHAARGRAFAPASLLVPEVALVRRGEEVWCTVAARVRPDDVPEQLRERIERRLEGLREQPLPLLDPHPTARHRVAGPMAPEHYEAAVARAVELIDAGRLEKIVLAREVDVHAGAPHDVAAISASCARPSRAASSTRSVAASPSSSARRPSSCCAARACA